MEAADLRRIAVVAIAAESEQAELVRFGVTQLQIQQQVLVQQHFGRGNVVVGAVFVLRAPSCFGLTSAPASSMPRCRLNCAPTAICGIQVSWS